MFLLLLVQENYRPTLVSPEEQRSSGDPLLSHSTHDPHYCREQIDAQIGEKVGHLLTTSCLLVQQAGNCVGEGQKEKNWSKRKSTGRKANMVAFERGR